MKRLAFLFLTTLLVFSTAAQQPDIAIIPEPVSVTRTSGTFMLPQNITVEAGSQPEVKYVTDYLTARLSKATGRSVSVQPANPSAAIRLSLNREADGAIGAEGYRLFTTPQGVIITANQAAGLFYGVQTLLQLLPKEIESATAVNNVAWEVPGVTITDYPRFGWRGLMFDVARHFFTKEEVKSYIDQMARYKYNLLHLHLADDEGWRIEIKSLPNLTKVGAWRPEKVGYFGSFPKPAPNEQNTYGGFYTQDDIRELVQYAKERFVNIMPEIDVPGHSLAAIVSYPELSCTPGVEKYRVRSGETIMNWHGNGTFTAIIDNTLCPANEKVYPFLDKVFAEIAQLFPFEYIHMGGDETAKNFWEKSPQIKALMKKEKLKDMHEVQSYFVKRVEKIIASKGKKMIGWDEILEGGLAPNAAVMSWRGMKGGIEAAKMGHEVVMSPTTYAYIDYMQADPVIEPRVYASLRLSKAYEFEPLPEGVDPKFIKGGQANLWTEQVYNMRHAQYMTWPRAFAIAESVWTPKEKKNWKNFFSRVEKHFERFDVAEVKYAPSVYDPIFDVSMGADSVLRIALSTEVEGLDIHYTFDNTFPDRFYPKYTQPLAAPKEAHMLRVITYRNNKPVGRLHTVTLEELKRRARARRA